MNLREFVIKEYQATVQNHPNLHPELKRALKTNERVPKFIDSLVGELSKPALKNKSNNQIRDVVHDSTLFFLNLIKQKADEQMMSDIQKMKIQQEIADKAIIDKACDTGIIDEEVMDVLERQAKEDTGPKTG